MFISPLSGYTILLLFRMLMMGITRAAGRLSVMGAESFLVADRKVGTVRGAFSIAASWIWAPALFISSQTEQNILGEKKGVEAIYCPDPF